MTLREVGDALHLLPGVSEATVFQIERSEETGNLKIDGLTEFARKNGATVKIITGDDEFAD